MVGIFPGSGFTIEEMVGSDELIKGFIILFMVLKTVAHRNLMNKLQIVCAQLQASYFSLGRESRDPIGQGVVTSRA